jgi:hypothetical protein
MPNSSMIIRVAAVDQLVVGELHINHFVPLHPAKLDHYGSGDHIERQLLCSAGFHAAATGNKLGSHNYFNGMIRMFGYR